MELSTIATFLYLVLGLIHVMVLIVGVVFLIRRIKLLRAKFEESSFDNLGMFTEWKSTEELANNFFVAAWLLAVAYWLMGAFGNFPFLGELKPIVDIFIVAGVVASAIYGNKARGLKQEKHQGNSTGS